MCERQEYPAGVPCWVDVMVPDPAAARAFYGGLFGWEFAVSDRDGYAVGRLGGRDVAGVGALEFPSWNTYVRVDRVEEALERATAAGGTVLVGATDALPAGRIGVLRDPGGAAIGLWEAGERAGAQVVNEPNTWTMSSSHVVDASSAVAFYRAVFGWEPEPSGRSPCSARRATSAEWRGSRSRATWSPRSPHPIPTSRRTGTSTSASPTPTRSPRRRLSWAGPC